MTISNELRNAIETLVKNTVPRILFLAEVTAVDLDALTCDIQPLDERAPYLGVQIRPNTDGEDLGVFAVPVVGSTVICGLLDNSNSQAFLVKVTDIDRAVIQVSDSQRLEFDTEGNIVFNGGSNGGLINIADLVTKLNNLENAFNAHLGIYNAHTHVYSPGPSAPVPTAPPVASDSGVLTATVRSELEDTKVKH